MLSTFGGIVTPHVLMTTSRSGTVAINVGSDCLFPIQIYLI